MGDDGDEEQCNVCISSCWYGKGKTFCAAHRTAWKKSTAQADNAAEPTYIAEMDDVVQGLGPLDDEWDEEEGDDPVYDHGGINPYYDFWEADPEGY